MKLSPARLLQLAAFLTPPIAVVTPLTLAVLLPLTALGVGLSAWHRRSLGMPPLGPTLVLAAVLAWSAASAAWAFEPRLVWSVWFQIAGLIAAGLVVVQVALQLDDEARQPIGRALAYGVMLALTFLAVEWASVHLFDYSLSAMLYTRHRFGMSVFNRGVATLAILVWPAALGVRRRWGAAAGAALVIVTLIVVMQYDSMAAIAGLLAGAAVYVVATRRPRAVAWALAGLVAIGAATAPVLPRLPVVDTLIERSNGFVSVSHRLQIWRFAAEAVAERPLAGWGLNASRDLPGGIGELRPGARKLPLHPHNAMLQWWLELGAVGAALGTALVILAIFGASRLGAGRAEPVAPTALATTGSAIVVALVGYGIWQGWWMAALWLAAGLMAAIGGARRS